MLVATAYAKDDLINAFIKFQTLIKKVSTYSPILKAKIQKEAHACMCAVDANNLETVRKSFVDLDRLITEVFSYNEDLQNHLHDESDVCFNIAAEIVEKGGKEW